MPECKNFKADQYLAVAAMLQKLGKDKAIVLLADHAGVRDSDMERRVIILCRMLFTAKPKGEFRRPSLGLPCFVSTIAAKDGLSVFKDWPHEPIELVDGVPFLVVHGYTIGGNPESARKYLTSCHQNCDWNTEAFKPNTVEEKQKALTKLMASPKWKGTLTPEGKKVLTAQIE